MRLHVGCFLIMVGLILGSCGDDKKNGDSAANKAPSLGSGIIVKAEDKGFMQFDFETKVDEQYVLLPFALGNLENVDGATEEKISMTVTSNKETAASLTNNGSQNLLEQTKEITIDQDTYGHAIRTLLNRFDPQKGMSQPAWWWKLIRELDQARVLSTDSSRYSSSTQGRLEAYFQNKITALNEYKNQRHGQSSNFPERLTGGCPTSIKVPGPLESGESKRPYEEYKIPDDVESYEDGTTYCIVYLSPLPTGYGETSKANIKASLDQVMTAYRDVIYQDTFEPTTNFTFKPVFIIVDFTDEGKWPEDLATIVGAHIREGSEEMKRPAIYVASDPTKVGQDKSKAKELFHSTMAHELQHAIMYFYKVQKNSSAEETAAIDEGIAYLMEDVFGFGEANFGIPEGFLQMFSAGVEPFLRGAVYNGELVKSNDARGAAQVLMYYLSSQKGGFTFEDGKISGGEGLAFIRAVVSGTKIGAMGLKEAFGGDWLTAAANYLGAVVLDGSDVDDIGDSYKVQDPEQIKDLLGQTKKFGMHFNGFGNLTKNRYADFTPTTDASLKDGLGDPFYYYETKPILYSVTDPSLKIKIETMADNAAMAVVRVK